MRVYKANCDDSGHGRSCYQYGRLIMRDKNISEADKLKLVSKH